MLTILYMINEKKAAKNYIIFMVISRIYFIAICPQYYIHSNITGATTTTKARHENIIAKINLVENGRQFIMLLSLFM